MQAEESVYQVAIRHYQLSQYEKAAKQWELPLASDHEYQQGLVRVQIAPSRNEWQESVTTKEDAFSFKCQVICAPTPYLAASPVAPAVILLALPKTVLRLSDARLPSAQKVLLYLNIVTYRLILCAYLVMLIQTREALNFMFRWSDLHALQRRRSLGHWFTCLFCFCQGQCSQ